MPEGPLAMLLGHALFGAVPLFLKLGLRGGVDSVCAVVLRFVVGLAIIFLLAAVFGRPGDGIRGELRLLPVNRRGLFWRGLWGGLAVFTYFIAVERLGAGLGTLLNYTHSLWSNVFALLWLGRRPSRRFWARLALAGLGVALVLHPTAPGRLDPGAVAVGLFSGMAGGAAVLTIKTLRRTDNALTINLALALGGLALALPWVAWRAWEGALRLKASAAAWSWVALAGVFSFGGQFFFNHGFRRTSVALASLIALLTPVLAVLAAWIWLGEALTPHALLGSACVLAALLLQGLEERRSAPKGDSGLFG
jgi:drug/metabolite transporter (DMT)-like permease